MKTCNLLFCGLAGVLATGCSLKMASTPEATANVPAVTKSTEPAVPLPVQTPFDGKLKARAAYLEFYALGYRFGVTDNASAGCLCGSEGAAEYYEASMSGFLAGKEAGSAALAKERQQNQAPTTAP
jgi:hypothetical protein